MALAFRIRYGLILNLSLALTGGAFGEDTLRSQGPPPELNRLASMVGVWDTTATYTLNPGAPTFTVRTVEGSLVS